MSQNIEIETQVRSLSKILSDLRTGTIQIPPFQRDFVWQRDGIKDLFDSIYKNYPIGSILLWKPKSKQPWTKVKQIGGFELPENDSQQVFVLDGYQRLSTLFGCLTNPHNPELKVNERKHNEFFNLYYDLSEESFIYLNNHQPEYYQVPVYVLMSTSEFRQYSRKYIEPFADQNKIDEYLDRADTLSRTLIDYKIAVIGISNAELEEAVDIFSRINSKGTDISYDWMVNALSYSNNFSFAYEIDSLKMALEEYNFGDFSRNNLFRCYQSAFDDKLYIDQTKIENLARREDFKKGVRAATPAIKEAVKFLYNHICVVESRLLPYTLQLIFIMKFFMEIDNPSKKQLMDLKQWFWKTSYSNYFTVNSLANQRAAFRHFIAYLRGDSETMLYIAPGQQLEVAPYPDRMILSSVRNKALILFELNHYLKLANKKPKSSLVLGKLVDNQDMTPANVVPFFGQPNRKSHVIDIASSLESSNDDLKSLYFIPRGTYQKGKENDEKRFLSERMRLISQGEAEFVRSLGDIRFTGNG